MNNRLNDTEECISDLEDGIKSEQQIERQMKEKATNGICGRTLTVPTFAL